MASTAEPVYNPPLTGGGVAAKDDGSTVVTTATALNFVDTASNTVLVTDMGSGVAKVEITATGVGSGGAATNLPFVVITNDASLSAERALAVETNVLSLTDGGANSSVTVGVATAGITYAKFQDVAARSLVGRAANSSGVSAAISGAGAGTYVNDNATTVAFRAVTDIIQNLNLSGDISPSQITADQNDYNPASLSTSAVLRLDEDAARAITGIAGGADGRILALFNIGSFNLTLTDASASSTAANRFDFSADLVLLPKHGALIWYDSTSSRWRLLSRGFPFTAAPSTRTLTAGAGLTGGGDLSADRTFTVAAGDSSITVNADDIIVASLGISTAKIAAAAVTYAKIQDVAARSLFGRSANSSGVGADIAGGGAGTYTSDNATSLAFRAVTDIIQNLNLSGDLTPAQITADQNDYNPASLSTAAILRIDLDAAHNLTGLAGGADGRVMLVLNTSAFTLTLKDESASSTAANRFTVGSDRAIASKEGLILWYDSTSSRWRPTTQAPGAGGGGAPTTAQYVTMTTDGTLSAERVATTTATISVTDGTTTVTWDVVNNAISDAKLRQGVARSVIGVTGNATANVADIQGTTDQVLRVNAAGTALAFGTIVAGGIASDAVTTAKVLDANITDAKLANMAARTLKGRSANSTGVPADIAGAGAATFASDDASTLAFRVVTELPQNIVFSGDLSPAQITSNQNDYNPTSLSTASTLRVNSDAARNVTGLAGGADGRVITWVNTGSFPITLSDASASSTAGNRFDFGTTHIIMPKQGVVTWYDSTSSRWRRWSGCDVPDFVNALTDGANIATNRDLGKQCSVTLGGNRTMDAPTGVLVDGMFLVYAIRQDGTGTRTITFASGTGAFRATGGCSLTPTLTTAINKTDYVISRYNLTDNKWELLQLTLAA